MSIFNGNEILGMGANISGGLGQTTPEGGEIFNDYENNKAISPKSHTEGQNNTSGHKGYKMANITVESDTSALIEVSDKNYDEKACNFYTIGDILQFSGMRHYNNALEITDISKEGDNSKISVMPLYGKFVKAFSDNQDEIYLALETEGDLSDENWCYVVGKNYGEVISRHKGIHTEGVGNIAIGLAARAQGMDNKAIGDYADAGGRDNVAGYLGFVRGRYNKATGLFSDTAGLSNESTGDCAHSSGRNNIASGKTSHVQNEGNTASHQYSDVAGGWNHSSADFQSVVGRFCADAPDALFVVGNGSSTDKRSNALKVNEDGTLTIGAHPKYNLDVATKGYVDRKDTEFKNDLNTTIKNYVDKQPKQIVFDTKEELINLVTKDIPTLDGQWATTSSRIGNQFENINMNINNETYITGCKVSAIMYQGFYLNLSLKANTSYKLKLNLLSEVKLESIKIVKASTAAYGASGVLRTTDCIYNLSSVVDLSKVNNLSNGVDFNIEFTTGTETEYHLYFKMGSYVDSVTGDYIFINPIYLTDDIDNLNVTDLNVGDILLVDGNQSANYWWNGQQIKLLKAEGIGTIVSAEFQTVVGKYNVADNEALFIVGNGTSDTDRSNAFVVYKNGSIEINGVKFTSDSLAALLGGVTNG